jgi:hypothetical protein
MQYREVRPDSQYVAQKIVALRLLLGYPLVQDYIANDWRPVTARCLRIFPYSTSGG